jgi:thiosulfate/3-mercaptopyruvate sulfurtransferase
LTRRQDLLVSPEALARELAGESAPVLLDVRWRLGGPPGLGTYREGHLPGAVFTDLDRDLAAPPGPAGRHPLPDPAAFQSAMRAAGVSQGRPVVGYDDRDATAAARAWWLLRYYGHQHVRVLDGGYQAWLAAGLPVSRADPAGAPGDLTARPGHMPVLDLARRFAALGADPRVSKIGAYCGSGVTAAHEVLALAGIPAALYVGSWSNWITDPARPIATGS